MIGATDKPSKGGLMIKEDYVEEQAATREPQVVYTETNHELRIESGLLKKNSVNSHWMAPELPPA